MGGACTNCCSTNTDRNSAPSKVNFGKNKKRADKFRVRDEYVRERFAILEGKYNVKLTGEKRVAISSSAFLPTGDVVLADSVNHKLKMFTCNFQIISCLEFPGSVQQVCASVNLPLLYACFPDRVRQIQVDGSQLKRSGFIKPEGTCRGVYVNRYEGKAVSILTDEDVGKVELLTPGGNVQLEIDDDCDGHPLFVKPDQIVVTRDLNVLVIDKGQHCVVAVSPTGELLFHYKGVRFPTGIVCDEQNYIYVSGPNSIHQLNEKGELVKLFVTKAEIGLSPLSICYNPQKKLLLVTGKVPKVSLFKMAS